MMTKALKSYLLEKTWLAADASDDDAKAVVSAKLKSGELTGEKYAELITEAPAKDKAKELTEGIASAVGAKLDAAFEKLATVLATKAGPEPKPDDDDPGPEPEPDEGLDKKLVALEERFMKMVAQQKPAGSDGASAMKAADIFKMGATAESDPLYVNVKGYFDRYGDTKTALTYKSGASKLLGLNGRPMQYNGKDVNESTDRTKAMSALWLKFQLFPERLTEDEEARIQWILHREKFHVPNAKNDTEARLLTEHERHQVWDFNKHFYSRGLKALIDDSTSGGEYSIPEFFDMDMIITPTLASENILSYCNVVPVPRGTSAQNFILGRPTIAAANTEGVAVGLFSTTGFLVDHDTPFFRAAGFIEIGKNFAEDAHPRLVAEIQNQYMESYRLWVNEQIMVGDGTTEPKGVTVSSGTTDVTPANPSTNTVVLNDLFDLLFGVGKAHRMRGGSGNAIYVGTENSYQRFRRLATGVTGDTRLVFGDNIESYAIFDHPFLIEEQGLTNSDLVFFQAKGYRWYQRQGPRFIREDRGDTLVRKNTFIVGLDTRAGGQLDEGAFAAVVDSLSL